MQDIINITQGLVQSPWGILLLTLVGGSGTAGFMHYYKRLYKWFTGTKLGGPVVIGIVWVLSNLALISSALLDLVPHLSGTGYAAYGSMLTVAAVFLRELSRDKRTQSVLTFLKDMQGFREYKAAQVPDIATVKPLPSYVEQTKQAQRATTNDQLYGGEPQQPTPPQPYVNL